LLKLIVGIVIGYFQKVVILKSNTMKTNIIFLSIVTLFFVNTINSQTRTTVNATNSEISDNLDLKAVASIFGDSENLEDFEKRLNDPKYKISNLDLNNDNLVDYLRVIESVERNTHLIVIQAILEKDIFQDVATIEVERDENNRMQVQVVGDVYMYGNNYIYEPVYVHSPRLFNYFWSPNYRIYYSSWNWGYYPQYYYNWRPFPMYRYHRNVRRWTNHNNYYNYVTIRRSSVAINLHRNVRANSYEVRNPERSFERRNTSVSNRYELDRSRTSNGNNRSENNIINNTRTDAESPRNNNQDSSPRQNTRAAVETPRRNQSESNTPRVRENNEQSTRNSSSRENRNSNSRR
jgi:hypothetical protein